MTDKELISALVMLDADETKTVNGKDVELLETALRLTRERRFVLSPKQRKWAEDILERYSADRDDEDDD